MRLVLALAFASVAAAGRFALLFSNRTVAESVIGERPVVAVTWPRRDLMPAQAGDAGAFWTSESFLNCSEPQLYDMSVDWAEEHDLALVHPETLSAILANFSVWHNSVLDSIENANDARRQLIEQPGDERGLACAARSQIADTDHRHWRAVGRCKRRAKFCAGPPDRCQRQKRGGGQAAMAPVFGGFHHGVAARPFMSCWQAARGIILPRLPAAYQPWQHAPFRRR